MKETCPLDQLLTFFYKKCVQLHLNSIAFGNCAVNANGSNKITLQTQSKAIYFISKKCNVRFSQSENLEMLSIGFAEIKYL